MFMTHFRHSVSLMIIFALTVVFIGCAKPPEAEKSAAKAAMDTAVSSGADKYAAGDLEAARKIWGDAEAQMKEKNYKEAKQGYEAAKVAFDKVVGAVEGSKKAAAAEAKAVVAGLEEDWNKLKMSAKNLTKKMKDKKMKEAWTTDTKAFTDGLSAIKDKIANDPASAKENVGGLKSIVEKWDATFKKLAADHPKHKATKKKHKPTKKRKK
jgi:hypothetical protein